MNTRTKLSLGLSALVLGGSMVGCTGNQGGLASAGTRDAAAAAKVAAGDAARARTALAKGDTVAAVSAAEAAVQLMPQNADYRALLGTSYLKAGRFASARAAFADVLALTPADGRSALNLALAETALGDWQAARATLEAHAATIAPADRGLAVALAGDPATGAQMLTDVVRSGQATPKARQNLALALALAGQWQGARIVAAADMSPADVDRRLEEWAVFAKPQSSSDQVAALLGVRPAQDPGQPVALALAAVVPVAAAVSEAPAAVAVQPAPAAPLAVPVATPPIGPAAPTDIAAVKQALASLPEAQPVTAPAPLLRAEPRPVKVALTPLLRAEPRPVKVALTRAVAPAPAKGSWYVQVGAFRNGAAAQSGWRNVTHRLPALARHVPTTARFAAKGGAFYRLAFGGFTRGGADSVCRRFKASGGACFVRTAAGDQIASWAGKSVQVAKLSKPVQIASR